MKSSDKPKLIIALVIFVIAAVVIAYQFGWIGGGATKTTASPPEAPKSGGPRTIPTGK